MIYLISYAFGWILALLYNHFNPDNSFAYNACLVHLVFTVGFFGLCNFVAHVLKRKQVAASIGWVSNGFQIELGCVSLGIGLCGILCYWFRDGFWLATIIPLTIFLFGASILHTYEMCSKRNFNPGNTLIILPNILMPATLILLLILK